jgi:ABC-type uncharacterized transport system ATPase subunit
MNDVARGGRTILFVSHNMGAVGALCSRAILLDHGRVSTAGACAAVVAKYAALGASSSSVLEAAEVRERRGARHEANVSISRDYASKYKENGFKSYSEAYDYCYNAGFGKA